MARRDTRPLEKDIEKAVKRYAKDRGFYVRKFTSPSNRSVPDDLFITPTGDVFFVEFKRSGEQPSEAQWIEIGMIRRCNVPVFIVDNVPRGKSIIDDMLTWGFSNAA